MERREAVIKISWMLKGAFLTPTILSLIQSCKREVSSTTDLMILSDKQDELIKAIADTIIPRTTTPSASDVNVDKFLDLLLKDVFGEEYKKSFINGLEQFDENCQSFTGNSFVELNEFERYDYLEKVDKKVMSNEEDEHNELTSFYLTFKKLIISIYFSTEQGVKQNLNYNPIPGPYNGEVEFKKGDKITVGNF